MASPEKSEWGPLFVKAGWVYPLSSSSQALHASAAPDDCWPSPLRLSLLPQPSLSSQSASSPQSGCINECVLHTVAQSRHTPQMRHPCKKHALFVLLWLSNLLVDSSKHLLPSCWCLYTVCVYQDWFSSLQLPLIVYKTTCTNSHIALAR